MKRSVFALIIITACAISILTAGCKTLDAAPKKESALEYHTTMRVSSSLNPPDDVDAPDPGFSYTYTSHNGVFEGSVTIKNRAEERRGYRLIAMIDYQTVPLTIEGIQARSHPLVLSKQSQKILRFKTPIGPGSHVLTVMALEDVPVSQIAKLNDALNDYANGQRFVIDGAAVPDSKEQEQNTTPGKDTGRILSITKSGKAIRIALDGAQVAGQRWLIVPVLGESTLDTFLLTSAGSNVEGSMPVPLEHGTMTVLAFQLPDDATPESLFKTTILQSNRLLLK